MDGPSTLRLFMNVVHSLANAPITIITNKIVDTLFLIELNDFEKSLNFVLIYNPKQTGTAVIINIINPRSKILIGGASVPIKYSIEKSTMSGKVITVRMLVIAVNDMDKAVSPLASFVIILEVTPPGQQARIIIPTANSLDKEKIDAIKKATIGKTIIWFIRPIRKALGFFNTLLKSEVVKPRPNESIIKISDNGNKTSIIII